VLEQDLDAVEHAIGADMTRLVAAARSRLGTLFGSV